MSIARQFLNEFRPLFRMLEDPLLRSPGYAAVPGRSVFDDPFFRNAGRSLHPAVDVSEEGNSYILEAEVPGVKREDLDVRVGEGGRSVTIEGTIQSRRPAEVQARVSEDGANNANATNVPAAGEGSTAIAKSEQSSQLSTERAFAGSARFSRTVWLPRPVDGENVKAKLTDGVLTLTIPKAEDKASVKIAVD